MRPPRPANRIFSLLSRRISSSCVMDSARSVECYPKVRESLVNAQDVASLCGVVFLRKTPASRHFAFRPEQLAAGLKRRK